MLDLPRIIGHRGAKAEAPENTLASIRQAHASGARWVEFDVKLTADGVPILIHDDTLERTTDGRGPVRARRLEQIRALDAGRWFDRRFAGERVPTLDEALEACVDLGLGVNIELKPCPGRAVETAEVALRGARASWPDTAPPPLISSFAETCLEVARVLVPDWPRGYLIERVPADWRARLERFGCATLNVGERRLIRAEVDAVVATGTPLLVYTVNDPVRAGELFGWGVAAIFTDRVARLTGTLLPDRPATGA